MPSGPESDPPTRTLNRGSSHPETEPQFARLDELESLRSHDGYLTFKMVWPRICQQTECATNEYPILGLGLDLHPFGGSAR